MTSNSYDHKKTEAKWAGKWEKDRLFYAPPKSLAKKRYMLFALPYPSGSGLHVGHVESKTALDIMSRFYRMQGEDVFFPVGWDAFGLPAENYAIKTGTPPEVTTKKAIETFVKQIKRIGISYNWETETSTAHPGYYKWTQWLFLQLFKLGLAYKALGMVNWCPSCKTALANEQVVNGLCERCDTQVVQKEMEQWYFRITKYLDELISGLKEVDWPAATVQQQLNWIGKKEGINISYPVRTLKGQTLQCLKFACFTTRPETNFGATFVVVAPEYAKQNLLKVIPGEYKEKVERYLADSAKKNELERLSDRRKKTGVFTGLYAVNQLNGYEMPIYVADFVLSTVGTGAVVGVPGHDLRDFEFARTFNLPTRKVVAPNDEFIAIVIKKSVSKGFEKQLKQRGMWVFDFEGWGLRVHGRASDQLSVFEDIVQRSLVDGPWYVHTDGSAQKVIFKDKIFSLDKDNEKARKYARTLGIPEKQMDWDDPDNYLMIYEGAGVMVNSGILDGLSTQKAAQKISGHLVKKGWGERVTTYRMRDWLISRQRYWGPPIPIVYDPKGKPHPVKDEHLPWMLPSDVDYNPKGTSPLGSSKELFARTEMLYGKGWTPEIDTMDTFVDSSWYFLRYCDPRNKDEFAGKQKMAKLLPVDYYMIGPEHIVLHLLYARFFTKFLRDEGYLTFSEPFSKLRHQGIIMGPDGKRMSKSRGNVINPDEVVGKFGADTLRIYEMFMGPLEENKAWDVYAINGPYRLLQRIYKLTSAKAPKQSNKELEAALHKLVQKLTKDIPELRFNVSIAAVMEFVNLWEAKAKANEGMASKDLGILVRILAPFAPFLAEELWSQISDGRNPKSVHLQSWPKWDEKLVADKTVEIVVQVNGKMRGTLQIDTKMADQESEVVKVAGEHPNISKWLGKGSKKTIFVPGRLVNFVV